VAVTWAADVVRVEVADRGGMSVPAVLGGADGEGGRGLVLAASLSSSLSFSGDEEGRCVRADILWAACGGPPPQDSGYGPEVAAALAPVQDAFASAVIWFGQTTGRWWAQVATASGDLLVEGSSPGDLYAKLARAIFPAWSAARPALAARVAGPPDR
jgi:hypothetical protein